MAVNEDFLKTGECGQGPHQAKSRLTEVGWPSRRSGAVVIDVRYWGRSCDETPGLPGSSGTSSRGRLEVKVSDVDSDNDEPVVLYCCGW